MPVSNLQPVYSPNEADKINASWGTGVATSVLQPFASAADRDLKWKDPPDGAMCFHDNLPWIYRATGTTGMTGWKPAVLQTYATDMVVPGNVNGGSRDFFMYQRWPGLPVCPYDAIAIVQACAWGGYAWQGGINWFNFQLYDNSEGAPFGGGWVLNGIGFAGSWHQDLGPALWQTLGTCIIQTRVPKGQKPGTVVRLNWSGGGNMYAWIRISWLLIPGKYANISRP